MKKFLRTAKVVLQAIHVQPETQYAYLIISGAGMGLASMSGWMAYYKKDSELAEYKRTIVPYDYNTMLVVPEGTLRGAREHGKVFRHWVSEADGYRVNFYTLAEKTDHEIEYEENMKARIKNDEEPE